MHCQNLITKTRKEKENKPAFSQQKALFHIVSGEGKSLHLSLKRAILQISNLKLPKEGQESFRK